jgi:hypothetical protein
VVVVICFDESFDPVVDSEEFPLNDVTINRRIAAEIEIIVFFFVRGGRTASKIIPGHNPKRKPTMTAPLLKYHGLFTADPFAAIGDGEGGGGISTLLI